MDRISEMIFPARTWCSVRNSIFKECKFQNSLSRREIDSILMIYQRGEAPPEADLSKVCLILKLYGFRVQTPLRLNGYRDSKMMENHLTIFENLYFGNVCQHLPGWPRDCNTRLLWIPSLISGFDLRQCFFRKNLKTIEKF